MRKPFKVKVNEDQNELIAKARNAGYELCGIMAEVDYEFILFYPEAMKIRGERYEWKRRMNGELRSNYSFEILEKHKLERKIAPKKKRNYSKCESRSMSLEGLPRVKGKRKRIFNDIHKVLESFGNEVSKQEKTMVYNAIRNNGRRKGNKIDYIKLE